jgi:hypothetical protein
MRCIPLYWTTKDHHQIVEIHAELKRLSGLMHYAGYVADTNFVLQEEEKVSHLSP